MLFYCNDDCTNALSVMFIRTLPVLFHSCNEQTGLGSDYPPIEFVLGIKPLRTETGWPVSSDEVQDCMELSALLHTSLCYGAYLNTGTTFEVQVAIVVKHST